MFYNVTFMTCMQNLSLTMEESNFMKAEVDADQSNAVKRMEEVKSDEDDKGDKKRINLG